MLRRGDLRRAGQLKLRFPNCHGLAWLGTFLNSAICRMGHSLVVEYLPCTDKARSCNPQSHQRRKKSKDNLFQGLTPCCKFSHFVLYSGQSFLWECLSLRSSILLLPNKKWDQLQEKTYPSLRKDWSLDFNVCFLYLIQGVGSWFWFWVAGTSKLRTCLWVLVLNENWRCAFKKQAPGVPFRGTWQNKTW